ncbi:conserved hypothetical protein [Gammaproteobacteria bacterium]
MQAYAYDLIMDKDGHLTIKDLPFNYGEKLEVIIISRSKPKNNIKNYPFWDKPLTYLNPTDSVSEVDWEVLK